MTALAFSYQKIADELGSKPKLQHNRFPEQKANKKHLEHKLIIKKLTGRPSKFSEKLKRR